MFAEHGAEEDRISPWGASAPKRVHDNRSAQISVSLFTGIRRLPLPPQTQLMLP